MILKGSSTLAKTPLEAKRLLFCIRGLSEIPMLLPRLLQEQIQVHLNVGTSSSRSFSER